MGYTLKITNLTQYVLLHFGRSADVSGFCLQQLFCKILLLVTVAGGHSCGQVLVLLLIFLKLAYNLFIF